MSNVPLDVFPTVSSADEMNDAVIAEAEAEADAKTCMDAAKLLDAPDEPDNPLVSDIIECGEVFAIVGQSKAGKSFLTLQMAVCIATGFPFLGRETTQKTIYVANLEVSKKQYTKRLRKIVERFGIQHNLLHNKLFIDNLKGECITWDIIRRRAKRYGAEVVFIDPFYQIFDGSENDDRDCKDAVNCMKKFYADGMTLGVVFHSPKGFSGDRQLIDAISGSSILARFPESVIGLLHHATEKTARVIDGVLRNYAPQNPMTVHFENGIFTVAPDTPPIVATYRTMRRAEKLNKGAECTARQEAIRSDLLEIVTGQSKPISMTNVELAMLRKGHGIAAIRIGIKSALAEKDGDPPKPTLLVKQPELDSNSRTGKKYHGDTFLMTPEMALDYRKRFEK